MAMFIGSYSTKLLEKHRQIILALMSLLVIVGFIHTSLRIFSDKDRGFFLTPSPRISRYTVANDEKYIAEFVAKEKITLYLYNWQFFQTLIYYSDINGGAEIERLTEKSILNPPYMLFIPSQLFNDSLPIPQSKKAGAEIVFKGEAVTLIKIYPTL